MLSYMHHIQWYYYPQYSFRSWTNRHASGLVLCDANVYRRVLAIFGIDSISVAAKGGTLDMIAVVYGVDAFGVVSEQPVFLSTTRLWMCP